MIEREAEQILDWLTGCFGKRLDENEKLVWMATLLEMDASRAMEIALQIGKNGDRFPTVPNFRQAMRFIQPDESWREQLPEALPIPEFVHIWYWSICTRGKDHRPFPQFDPKPSDAMTIGEYEDVRELWKQAGSPHVRSINEILQTIT